MQSDFPIQQSIFFLIDAVQRVVGGSSGKFPQYHAAYLDLMVIKHKKFWKLMNIVKASHHIVIFFLSINKSWFINGLSTFFFSPQEWSFHNSLLQFLQILLLQVTLSIMQLTREMSLQMEMVPLNIQFHSLGNNIFC